MKYVRSPNEFRVNDNNLNSQRVLSTWVNVMLLLLLIFQIRFMVSKIAAILQVLLKTVVLR